MPWAHASDTPFRAYEHFTQEVGIATPLIAHWPAGIPEAQRGTVTDAQGPIMDVMATALDAAGTAYPEAFERLRRWKEKKPALRIRNRPPRRA